MLVIEYYCFVESSNDRFVEVECWFQRTEDILRLPKQESVDRVCLPL